MFCCLCLTTLYPPPLDPPCQARARTEGYGLDAYGLDRVPKLRAKQSNKQ